MQDETMKILEMLEAGTIDVEEASILISALQDDGVDDKQEKIETAKRMEGKKLHVEVNGDTKESKNMNINVRVPLVLARYADNILANFVPTSVTDELEDEGINLRNINISEIVDVFEELDEDIVNADINQDDMNLKVRVYVA